MKKKKNFSISWHRLLTYLVMAAFAITIAVPICWVFIASIKADSEFYGNPWALPEGIHLENFVDAWNKARMGEFFLTSIMVTVMAIVMLLAIALPAAYVLSRFEFKFRRILNILFMAGLFINMNYIVVPIFLMFVDADNVLRTMIGTPFFLNNRFILALVYAATALPFSIYLLSGYFSTLSKEFEEAAYVDGAGYAATMVKIILPMARPSILTVLLFNFLSIWNEYILAMTLLTTPNGARTLPVGLMNLMKAQNAAAQYGQMYAGLVMVMLPTLILYMCLQKKLTQGMTLGGVKG